MTSHSLHFPDKPLVLKRLISPGKRYLKTINQIKISHRYFKTIYLSLEQIN